MCVLMSDCKVCVYVLMIMCIETKPLLTTSVQMAIQTRWLSFRRKQTWFVIRAAWYNFVFYSN